MASVTLRGIEKFFGSVKVIHGVDIDIGDGEFVVLVGPSGCGKSTLLRMIAGLEETSAGEISIGDRVVNNVTPRDRDVAMVFQNYALYPHKTVYDNMAFGLKLRKANRALIAERVKKAADILGLNDLLGRYPRQLSGGQRQRVAMGRAIVRDPQLFLFDEPLSNLDAKLRVQTRTQIAALQRRLGTTTVYVTHDQVEAMTMGDRVAVLRNGKLQQFATPSELYDRPANAFVAGFIGSPAMNLLTVPITADGVKIGGSTLELERDDMTKLAESGLKEVIFGIRPEALELSDSGGVEVVVDLVEDLGSEAYLYTHAGGDVQLVARSLPRIPARLADTIRLRRQADAAVHLFHPDTGERIN
jgi:multiple sugar transport system ATP-binding protein